MPELASPGAEPAAEIFLSWPRLRGPADCKAKIITRRWRSVCLTHRSLQPCFVLLPLLRVDTVLSPKHWWCRAVVVMETWRWKGPKKIQGESSSFKKIVQKEGQMNQFSYFLFSFFLLLLATMHSMQDLSSPTRDWTQAPCSGSTES